MCEYHVRLARLKRDVQRLETILETGGGTNLNDFRDVIMRLLEIIDCNLPKGLARQENRSLVGEIEDLVIAYGERHGLTGGEAILPNDEFTLSNNVFHDLLDALHKLQRSITPKECFHYKESALALLKELEENVR